MQNHHFPLLNPTFTTRALSLSSSVAHRLGRTLHESRVTNDLADLAVSLLKFPLPFIAISESDIPVFSPEDHKRLIRLIEDLAPVVLFLDQLADTELHRLERSARSHGRRFDAALARGEHGLGPELDALVLEHDAEAVGVGADLLERRVADHLADLGGAVTESPGPGSAVGEGDVGVGAAEADDGLLILVEDLAAQGLLLDVLADLDFDLVEGPVAGRIRRIAFAFLELHLGAGFGGAAKGDADLLVNWVVSGAAGGGGSEGAGGGEEGEDDGRVLHF